ncbi:MAG: hypothetical protein HC834_02805 [Rhodospirillales bacterium]|nr:hypothetical protein [Rhodospirillales bacterium]
MSKRASLWKHSADVTDYLSAVVQKHRDLGATEGETIKLLDNLELQVGRIAPQSRLRDDWFSSPAYAQSPTDLSCVVPQLVATICLPSQFLKAVGISIFAVGASKAAVELGTTYQQSARVEEWVWEERVQRTGVTIPSPPGDCGPEEYKTLKADVDQWCHGAGYRCTDAQSETALMQNLDRAQKCFRARRTINMTCFKGGDATHVGNERDVVTSINACIRYIRALRR